MPTGVSVAGAGILHKPADRPSRAHLLSNASPLAIHDLKLRACTSSPAKQSWFKEQRFPSIHHRRIRQATHRCMADIDPPLTNCQPRPAAAVPRTVNLVIPHRLRLVRRGVQRSCCSIATGLPEPDIQQISERVTVCRSRKALRVSELPPRTRPGRRTSCR
jgi:hypothetical protein